MSPRPLSHSSERPCQAALWSQGQAITPLRVMRLSPLTAVPRQRCAFQMKAPLPKATTPPRQQEEGAPKGCVISLQSGRGGSPSEKGTCVGVIKNKGLECVHRAFTALTREVQEAIPRRSASLRWVCGQGGWICSAGPLKKGLLKPASCGIKPVICPH